MRLRELLEHLIRAPAVFRAAASQIERGLAKGDLQWLPGKAPVYPPQLLKNIEDIWQDILDRRNDARRDRRRRGHRSPDGPDRPPMSVNPITRRAGGAFIHFAVACLELLSFPANPTAVRAAVLRDRARQDQRNC
jgi:hypothetical protein